MIQTWVWGDVPTGFKRCSPNSRQLGLVREGLEGCLDPAKFFAQSEMARESPFSGRARIGLFPLGNGEAALIRTYRHGGILRHLTGDFFFTWPPRPFKELVVTAEVSRRGVPTLEILGACVERVWGPVYRGWLITRELEGAYDFWAALERGLYSEGEGHSLLKAVARSLRRMHLRGVYHGDLNLKNILVRREGDQVRSYIIDFDKARLFSGEVPPKRARRNLMRLLRSICKLDPDRRSLSPEAWELFTRFYREADVG